MQLVERETRWRAECESATQTDRPVCLVGSGALIAAWRMAGSRVAAAAAGSTNCRPETTQLLCNTQEQVKSQEGGEGGDSLWSQQYNIQYSLDPASQS